ncbi:MAG: putative glycolipid-binding domain-containing protein [Nakamurella sp.]
MSAALGPARLLTWSSDDGRRLEAVRIVMTERGLRASGYLVVVGRHSYGATFTVLCDAAGRTRRLNVQSDSALTERGLSLTRTPGGPWLDGAGKAPPREAASGLDLNDALDIDLTASAFTNSLAIRRLGLHRRYGDEQVMVAEIAIPDLHVLPLEHTYRTVSLTGNGAKIHHHGPAGEHDITVDRHGFVIDLPHLSYRLR